MVTGLPVPDPLITQPYAQLGSCACFRYLTKMGLPARLPCPYPLTVSLPNAQNLLAIEAVVRWLRQHEDSSSLSYG